VVTNMLHSHLSEVMTTVWLLTDNVLTEATPKAASSLPINMHVLANLLRDLQRRYPVRDGEMVSQRGPRSEIGETFGSLW
jgi:hypothetical protein